MELVVDRRQALGGMVALFIGVSHKTSPAKEQYLKPSLENNSKEVIVKIPPAKPIEIIPEKTFVKHKSHPHSKRADRQAEHLRAKQILDTPNNRHYLALTMWGEARSYGEQGMRAVGHVILNRVKANKNRFGHSIKDVCLKDRQFSCWLEDDPNFKRMNKLPKLDQDHPDWEAWVVAVKLSGKLLVGADKDNTGGATFYHTETIIPYWRNDMTPIGVMYGHIFYKEKKRSHHHKHKSHSLH